MLGAKLGKYPFGVECPAGQSTTLARSGGSGALGDILSALIVMPEAGTRGSVTLKDGSLDAVTQYAGGTTANLGVLEMSVTHVLYGIDGRASQSGPWVVTCGAAVHAVAVGVFS